MIRIKEEIKALDKKDKEKVLVYFAYLMDQFMPSSGFTEPHYLFIDNSILQDIKNKSSSQISYLRYLSTLIFSDFLSRKSKLDIKLAITPAIFYEFSGRKSLENEYKYQEILEKVQDSVDILNIETYTIGFSSFSEINKLIDKVKIDEEIIISKIRDIKNTDWSVRLRFDNGIKFPHAVANKYLSSDLQLKYFDDGYVRWVLSTLIEREIITNKHNDEYVRRNFRHDMIFLIAALNKIKKGIIQGLGDIELLQFCDITGQQYRENNRTCTGITFDENLRNTLAFRTGTFATHEPFKGGESQEERDKKILELQKNIEKQNQIHQKEDMVMQRALEYYRELSAIFT
ncbi:hypothetical protein [Endozoicomonas sp. 4G]|uniref:hypothetical protein n=1 Tax=Endozoicomonas sp. 4G TaxID=2872754 RepID=UPI0020788E05|nr:hypothetical protein [Endozoicomonas sp. 4G]